MSNPRYGQIVTVVVCPSEAIPREWVAHCLDLDIVTQGNSPKRTLDAMSEALTTCISDDLNRNLDPLNRKPAPPEDWKSLKRDFSFTTQFQIGWELDERAVQVAELSPMERPPRSKFFEEVFCENQASPKWYADEMEY